MKLTKIEQERLDYLETLIREHKETYEEYQEACSLKRKEMEPEYD